MLRLENVEVRQGGFTLQADTQVPEAARVALMGASGSGKSTLLSLVCGTLLADRGEVRVAGTDLSALPAAKRDRFRAEHIGVIFQQFNLLPYATVLDNILLPLQFAPNRRKRAKATRDTVAQMCADLSLPHNAIDRRASALSVGQQQRVAAARALIGSPPLILADEPTSALDTTTQTTFLELLFRRAGARESAILMVSHDARLATQFDRVVEMSDIASETEVA